MDEECPFCRVIEGEKDAHVVYEDARTIAFFDENPACVGHTLVVPTAHRPDLLIADAETNAAVFETVRKVSTAMEATLEPDGFSVFYSTGPIVGRVEHAHVHLLPRYEDDDISLSLRRTALEDETARELTDRIREEL
ncbi:HIT family protein [Halopiger aswanensis]|uniref:Histidine triad (HIT) family protein n=1 Tax=Halopiger aswanensis TaxID=148449 RepID=A0A3R7DF14_9EURY|nr:HIT family protein [Halopiger aswanensis]RKD97566.1 histidine triad (HIT) family protein [Halopiger aswanensis]